MQFLPLTKQFDEPLAKLIRTSLKAHHLNIPGTAYYDDSLDHLSEFYNAPKRAYYVVLEEGTLIGGIGLAELEWLESCCELQKLYLDERAHGRGLGYDMIRFIEEKGRELGYRQIYLETHTNLGAAIHIYEKSGYRQIERPECVVHSTMNRFYLKWLQQ